MDAAEDDHIRAGAGRLLRKTEGVAHEIRHVLNLWHLVVVREDDGVVLALEGKNFAGKRLGLGGRARTAQTRQRQVGAARLGFGQINHAKDATGQGRERQREGPRLALANVTHFYEANCRDLAPARKE